MSTVNVQGSFRVLCNTDTTNCPQLALRQILPLTGKTTMPWMSTPHPNVVHLPDIAHQPNVSNHRVVNYPHNALPSANHVHTPPPLVTSRHEVKESAMKRRMTHVTADWKNATHMSRILYNA